jgi:hypothetical protein
MLRSNYRIIATQGFPHLESPSETVILKVLSMEWAREPIHSIKKNPTFAIFTKPHVTGILKKISGPAENKMVVHRVAHGELIVKINSICCIRGNSFFGL